MVHTGRVTVFVLALVVGRFPMVEMHLVTVTSPVSVWDLTDVAKLDFVSCICSHVRPLYACINELDGTHAQTHISS